MIGIIKIASKQSYVSSTKERERKRHLKRYNKEFGTLQLGAVGAAIGGGLNAARAAYKNRKKDPSDRKSVWRAAGKGALVGGASGASLGALGKRYAARKKGETAGREAGKAYDSAHDHGHLDNFSAKDKQRANKSEEGVDLVRDLKVKLPYRPSPGASPEDVRKFKKEDAAAEAKANRRMKPYNMAVGRKVRAMNAANSIRRSTGR